MAQAFHGGRLTEAAQEFGLPIERLIDFSSNINPFAPAITPDQWQEWQTDITRYPEADAAGLQRQLAEVYEVEYDHVLPTSGGIEALYLAARLFAGKKVGVVEPAFGDYTRAFEALGEPPCRLSLPMEAWSMPINSWADCLRSLDVVVLGNPNNPTGSFQTRADLLALWQQPWARAQSWILDEAFLEFVPDWSQETLLRDLPENVIVLRSLTKSWGLPGLRLGFLATSNPRWMTQLRRMQPPWSINAVAQAWAKAFLTSENHAKLLAGLRELHQIKRRFQARLHRIDGIRTIPSSANFLLIHLADSLLDSSTLYQQLGQRGLITRRCDSFYDLPRGRFLRVAVKSESDNNFLAESLSEICADLMRRAA